MDIVPNIAQLIAQNLLHPPVLFFLLGIVAVLLRSDLEIPPAIAKFLSLYLLFNIGTRGGEELSHSGFSANVWQVLLVCIAVSFLTPFVVYRLLRWRLKPADAAAVAASYGSISAVTFATALSFLEVQRVAFGGHMVASMALMESPAIMAGLLLYGLNQRHQTTVSPFHPQGNPKATKRLHKVIHEALCNGSVLLLVGSLLIGLWSGQAGETELKPFVTDIFKGMLCFYMLDMGLLAARRFDALRRAGWPVIAFALIYPLLGALAGLLLAKLLQLDKGDSLLMMVLVASASYIAVPAAMRTAIPEANMSIVLPMALGLTFTFNVTMGIPLYYQILQMF